jgi:hypothetical protein
MSQVVYNIEKEWKEHSISLPLFEEAVKLVAGAGYCGNSAGEKLVLHFTAEPSEQEKADIDALWDAIDENHAIATGYVNAEAIAAEVAAKKASGKAKLADLGLTPEEIQAILG